jgi:dihydroorotate dehydrogenase
MIMGLKFPNRVGLAAGLDKNAEYITPFQNWVLGLLKWELSHLEVSQEIVNQDLLG